MHEWWDKWPDQKFWLEATDREDIGADLRAPELDESGKDNWRYTLFKATKPDNIVLHYNSRTEPNGIVGWSDIAGAAACRTDHLGCAWFLRSGEGYQAARTCWLCHSAFRISEVANPGHAHAHSRGGVDRCSGACGP